MPLIREYDTVHIGRQVHLHAALPSTFDEAERLDAPAGTVVVADHQSAGRGQYGRTWATPPGAALLLTAVLDPPAELRRPVVLTAWAAVAVAEAVLELAGVQARIKWPNDLLIRGKKVCGILIEQRGRTLVGLGLNLAQSAADFATAGLPDATSLFLATGRAVSRDDALACVLRHLDAEYGWLVGGERVRLEADWKWRVGLLGRAVEATLADGTVVVGRLREMGFDGLELETPEGTGFRVLRPEAVRQISAQLS